VRSQYVEAEYALELIGGDARGVGYLLKDRISESRISLTPSIAWPGGGSVLDPDVVQSMRGRPARRDSGFA
jgi:hypothetical protein